MNDEIVGKNTQLNDLLHDACSAYRLNKLGNGTKQLVHYTSAENAMNILSSMELWMRNVRTMNDYSEIEHGIEGMIKAFKKNTTEGAVTRERINNILPNLFEDAAEKFECWYPSLLDETYVACLSIHLPKENETGRLSMWRGYGSGTKAALIIQPEVFASTSDALAVFSDEVEYTKSGGLGSRIEKLIELFEDKKELIDNSSRDVLMNYLCHAMVLTALCTKHKGFDEEKEWRLFSSPFFGQSELVKTEIKTISGSPQKVKILKIKNYSSHGIVGADIKNLVDKVIVGPSEDAKIISESFVQKLKELNFENSEEKVIISSIPFRNR